MPVSSPGDGGSQGFGFLKGGTCDGEGFPSRRHFSTARDVLCDALTRQIAALGMTLLHQKGIISQAVPELRHRPLFPFGLQSSAPV